MTGGTGIMDLIVSGTHLNSVGRASRISMATHAIAVGYHHRRMVASVSGPGVTGRTVAAHGIDGVVMDHALGKGR